MGEQTFTISPVTSKDEFDGLGELAVSYHQLFPEDATVLGNALAALEQNGSSLLGVGRLGDDRIAFFVIGLDGEPTLQAIYVPPGLRNFRLGSHLFVNMATMMHVENVARVSFVAWGRNIRFFERFGARPIDERADMNGTRRMSFAPSDLTRPTDWFEKIGLPPGG